jgi:hypothetical protein
MRTQSTNSFAVKSPFISRLRLELRRTFAGLCFLCVTSVVVLAGSAIDFEVASRIKTTKTGEGGSTSSKTTHYVERMIINVNIRDTRRTPDVELICYFVARHVQSQVLKYCGFERRSFSPSAKSAPNEFQSQPVSYSQSKDRNSTHESKRGHVAYGWVVIATAGGTEIATKASSPEILRWVRQNPPRERN